MTSPWRRNPLDFGSWPADAQAPAEYRDPRRCCAAPWWQQAPYYPLPWGTELSTAPHDSCACATALEPLSSAAAFDTPPHEKMGKQRVC